MGEVHTHLIVMWRVVTPWKDLRKRHIMYLANRILGPRIREKVRGELGLTYTISTKFISNPAYPTMSALVVDCTTNPNRVTKVMDAVKAVVAEFALEGPTDTEMKNFLRQVSYNLERRLYKPDLWIYFLKDLEYRNKSLEGIVNLANTVMSFTKGELLAEVQKVVRDENLAVVIAAPKTSKLE